MFGFDFSKLTVIFIVALVVFGPKRMPGLVRKVGRWVGKARSMARDFQQQLENEVNLEELSKMTGKQTRDAHQGLPEPPPGFNGEPAAPESAPESTPTYPYSVPETPATDDTFSHAHAAGEASVPHEPVPAATESAATAAESAVTATPAATPAAEAAPVQASLDLSSDNAGHHS